MRTSADSLNRERLEIAWNQDQPQAESLKLPGLKGFFQRLLQFFVGANDLRIWQTSDRLGHKWWHAYDPATGRRTSVDSETEMRAWIEQHYYH